MPSVKQLSEADTLFIAGESRATYNHTAGLLVLNPGTSGRFDFDQALEKMSARIGQLPQFHWKMHEIPLGLDLPYWVEDENFSYRHHIKRIAVPSPGDLNSLGELTGHLFSKHMDRNIPLWEAWFIEGLAGGKYAVMLKLHHCMMDGQGAVKLLEILCDLEPEAPPREVPEKLTSARPGKTPSALESGSRAYFHLATFPWKMGRELLELASPKIRGRVNRGTDNKQAHPFYPHPTLNSAIGPERGFVFGSLALNDIKKVKQHFDVSVNEVVLALVGAAMRTYLTERSELPTDSLRASMPVSLRSADDDDFSNKVTTVVLPLGTDIEDPVARLKGIHEQSVEAKRGARKGGKGITDILQMLPPVFVSALTLTVNAEQAAGILGANLVVSNVHGCPVPVYLAGARVETLYPMSVIAPGLAMNITCVSYDGKLDFGLTLDPDVMPDAWSLMSDMESALAEYLSIAGGKSRGKSKRKATRKKRAPAKSRG